MDDDANEKNVAGIGASNTENRINKHQFLFLNFLVTLKTINASPKCNEFPNFNGMPNNANYSNQSFLTPGFK